MKESEKFQLDEIAVARFGFPDIVASLVELVRLASSGDSGGECAARKLLLGLYDGSKYPFDLSELQRLDDEYFEDAMNCIRLRVRHRIEPHEFFINGSAIFKRLTGSGNTCPLCDSDLLDDGTCSAFDH